MLENFRQNLASRWHADSPRTQRLHSDYIHELSGLRTLEERLFWGTGCSGARMAVLGCCSVDNPSLKPMIQEEQTDPPRFLSSTPTDILTF